ncbi:MAG TPA: hypothetical protein VGM73_17405 [Candidatus Didemnitutus sp.]|jgi:hypothetical protein
MSRFLLIRLFPLVALIPAGVALHAAPALIRGDGAGGPETVARAQTLQPLLVAGASSGSVEVSDGAGRVYLHAPAAPTIAFRAGGALGRQHVVLRDARGAETGRFEFTLEAATRIDDHGAFGDMFALFRRSMNTDSPTGVSAVTWNGRSYHYFEPWMLDHYHTMKGMKYFAGIGAEFVDLMRTAQRDDGMIWSFILTDGDLPYYQTCYGPFGYVRQYGDHWFVRQPVENHPEYIFVSAIYQCWKAAGDDAWMRASLAAAQRALDYTVNDPARWSRRFQLLKRVYTIDSWDFAVDDEYTPDIGLNNTMLIDPVKSKFGVFFSDNTHYAAACDELAEMLDRAGNSAAAAKYRERGAGVRQRLDALSWNGRFYTHFIDEDPSVQRHLGVDERSQIAQANAYSLNRGIGRDHSVAIIRTYLDLKDHLPVGSPGEWYAIYPPFGRGFGRHDAMWQYMNGGVGGHVAGELARGAFENGYENYGLDVLERLTALADKYDHKVYFAYTGSIPPPPPPPNYSPVDLSRYADMDHWDQGGPHAAKWMMGGKPGDDIRGLPVGRHEFAGIPFQVADPAANERRSILAVSHRPGLPASVEIAVGQKAGAVYLLHTSTKPESEKIVGSIAFLYEDGSRRTQYLVMDKQLTYWWFSRLKTESSGIAWHGPSPVAADVGLSWCAIDNPEPDKVIRAITVQAPETAEGIYTLAGLTLADRPHYVAPSPVSYGGPDNWAAATAMAALVEGLAGVKDAPGSEAYRHPVISPRWTATKATHVSATIRYEPSEGYVAYEFSRATGARTIGLMITGGGQAIDCRILLPKDVAQARSVTCDGSATPFQRETIGESSYVDFALADGGPHMVTIAY